MKRSSTAVLGNVALAMLGVGMALGSLELLLRAFPNWVPRAVRVNPPVRRVNAFVDEVYDLKLSDGDLFHWMQGTIAPLSPEEDRVVARVHMMTDAHGFRNLSPEQATYGMVALGDSFTRASGVAMPWPERLAEITGGDVLNLADVGVGPQEELQMLQQYGLGKRPGWVIQAYFEGNDLYDAAAYAQANPFILARFGRYVLAQSVEMWHERSGNEGRESAAPDFRYPITVTINGTDLEMALFSSYVAWLSLSSEAIESSHNYRLVTETVLTARDVSEAAGARYLLVYLPTKEHVYLPNVTDTETQARIYADVPTIELDETGYLHFTDQKATPELVRQHMDVQANLLADFAAAQNVNFLDLTPALQAEAGAGAEMYYPYDTHWNQRGHDLAAQTIAGYVESVPAVTSR